MSPMEIAQAIRSLGLQERAMVVGQVCQDMLEDTGGSKLGYNNWPRSSGCRPFTVVYASDDCAEPIKQLVEQWQQLHFKTDRIVRLDGEKPGDETERRRIP